MGLVPVVVGHRPENGSHPGVWYISQLSVDRYLGVIFSPSLASFEVDDADVLGDRFGVTGLGPRSRRVGRRPQRSQYHLAAP